MKLIIKKGRTSLLVDIFIQANNVTTGAGLTGLVFNTSSLTGYYARPDQGNANATAITLATATRGTWASGGFKEKDATNMPGVYELGIPDACLATGAENVVIMLKGAANMATMLLEIQLVAYDPQVATNLGLSALPTANPGAVNGVLIAGTNAPVVITGSGDALTLSSTGSNGNGINISANGSGDAIKATAGATGNGLELIGGATSGDGLKATTTAGHGMNIVAAGTAKDGIHVVGAAAATTNAGGHGISATGGAATTSAGGTAGKGVLITGGAGAASTNGAAEGVAAIGGGTTTVSGADGIKSTATGNLHGLELVGSGSGDGIKSTGGSSGNAMELIGGSSSGDGLKATVTSGVPIRGNITGNVTGNLSGSVGSVTGDVAGNVNGNVVGSVAEVLGNVDGNVNGGVVGAVASVTGNVGGNVVGTVGSVAGNVGGNVVGSVASVASGGITRASFDVGTGLQTIRSNTAAAGASGTITLDAAASSVDDFYNSSMVYITGGTGAGQVRFIINYVGSTQVATISPDWATAPDNTSTFAILPVASCLDDLIESAISMRQMTRGMAAAMLGKAAGLNSTTVTYRDTGDNLDRITATVDTVGDRTSVALDLSPT